MNRYAKSEVLYEKAEMLIPGGVNSPVRAFKSVGMNPVFIESAFGSKLFDKDNNEYVDYIGSWGPMILGHCNPNVTQEVCKAVETGTSFGLSSSNEVELAEIIIDMVPSIEKVRLTTSGTEAGMAAVRLARAYTGKNMIVKFAGCYHGHSDSLLVKAGSGSLTFNQLDSNGITASVSNDTLTADYNDLEGVKRIFTEYGDKIACIIIEPIAANMGVIEPAPGFLEGLSEITHEYGALLIFDEVISGFRIGPGGAQELYGITPDLTVLGKIIGGGFPIGAFGGRTEIMDHIAPVGGVYHAGTLSGNPVAVAAGLTTLKLLNSIVDFYENLEKHTKTIVKGIEAVIAECGVNAHVKTIGSLFTLFFTSQPVNNLNDVSAINTEIYGKYFRLMLDEGIMLPPSQFEACFVSYSHDNYDTTKTIEAVTKVLQQL